MTDILTGTPSDVFGEEQLRVSVLNAPGVEGEAEALADLLDAERFEVVKIGTSKKEAQSPIISVKPEHRPVVDEISAHLAVKPKIRRLKPEGKTDIIVVLTAGAVRVAPGFIPGDKDPVGEDVPTSSRSGASGKTTNPHKMSRSWSVMLNPAQTAVGIGAGGFLAQADVTYRLFRSHAIGFLPGGGTIDSGGVKGTTVELGVAWQWHVVGRNLGGIFVGPLIGADYFSLKEDGTAETASKLGLAGYRWIARSGFTLLGGAGAAYLVPGSFGVGDSRLKFPIVLPKLFLEVGYSF